MRFVRAGLLTLLWLALLPAVGRAADLVPLPALSARVTDLTGTLDETQRGRLEAQLAAIDRTGRAQIAVLLVPTTQPEAIEQFGIRLAEAWKIGHKGADNGLIIIVAKDDRKMRIEVGYGLEGPIPDAIAKRIISERMAPLFKQGNFFAGIADAVTALEATLGGETPLAATGGSASSSTFDDGNIVPWFMAFLMFSGLVRQLFGLVGALAISGLGAWVAYSAFASLPLAVAASLLVFLLSFVRPGGAGSGGGWSGGGSSSDGGFSGGGGSFGGGGASGDW
ncbi:MAG: TPM domain-containing protein [Rhodocyclales bacterium]|nr:TPM domain-containing protein [Rhodocyclales bacterium]